MVRALWLVLMAPLVAVAQPDASEEGAADGGASLDPGAAVEPPAGGHEESEPHRGESLPAAAALPEPPPAAAAAVGAAGGSRRAVCVVGDHAGISDADARTAASIVCGELVTHGPRSNHTYQVSLGRLGSIIVLTLTDELADGTVAAQRRLSLENIEEVPVAAPRVVAALLDDRTVQETETVENLVGEDTRPLKKREGASIFGLGVIGLIADVEGPTTSVGADMAFGYEASAMAIGFDLRFAAVAGGEGVGMFATGPFGRYFLTKTDISPFIGGGLGPMLLRMEREDLRAEQWGLVFWAEAGVEIMRTHESQLVAGARLDIPAFAVSDDTHSGYVLPLEIVAAFNFD